MDPNVGQDPGLLNLSPWELFAATCEGWGEQRGTKQRKVVLQGEATVSQDLKQMKNNQTTLNVLYGWSYSSMLYLYIVDINNM